MLFIDYNSFSIAPLLFLNGWSVDKGGGYKEAQRMASSRDISLVDLCVCVPQPSMVEQLTEWIKRPGEHDRRRAVATGTPLIGVGIP